MGRFVAALAIVALAGIVAASPARADDSLALTPSDTSLSDAEIDRRIRFLEERLDDSKFHGQAWYWSWMTINVGSAAGSAYAAYTFDGNHDDRVNAGVSAVNSAIGIIDLLARPLEARHGADRIRPLPEATRGEKIAKLRAAENQLASNAERAEQRWSPVDHAGNAALALISGVVVGTWGNPTDGAIAGASVLVGGWINLLSAPWEPEDDWKDYKASIGHDADRTHLDFYMTAYPDGGKAGIVYHW